MRKIVVSAAILFNAEIAFTPYAWATNAEEFLREIQGVYKPSMGLDCDQAIEFGEVTTNEGGTLHGLETRCTLDSGQAVGNTGAYLFNATCSEEGDVGTIEVLLHSDGGGALAILKPYSTAIWYACD